MLARWRKSYWIPSDRFLWHARSAHRPAIFFGIRGRRIKDTEPGNIHLLLSDCLVRQRDVFLRLPTRLLGNFSTLLFVKLSCGDPAANCNHHGHTSMPGMCENGVHSLLGYIIVLLLLTMCPWLVWNVEDRQPDLTAWRGLHSTDGAGVGVGVVTVCRTKIAESRCAVKTATRPNAFPHLHGV